ncbi:hypothetical protein HMI51_38940 [Corallococcus coralloides]|nr:hypothetical protein [Corallococcus coralloides]
MAKQVEKPEWARVAEAFEASGQTQREFALARGMRLSTLVTVRPTTCRIA